MSLVRINTAPSPSELRLFGSLAAAFLVVIGILAARRHGAVAGAWAWVPAAGFAAFAFGAPKRLRLPYIVATCITFPIGFVASHLILGIAYYVILSPAAIVARWFGYDPLQRRFERGKASYWEPRAESRDPESYFHQS